MNKNEIGEYIAGRRDTLAISQAQLAKLCSVSVHTLSNLETGNGNVTLETLLKIAGILGLDISVGARGNG